MNVLKTWFQGADDDARQIHREVSGEPHVLPLLPHPMASSQENTQDVMSKVPPPWWPLNWQGKHSTHLFRSVKADLTDLLPIDHAAKHIVDDGSQPRDPEFVRHVLRSVQHGSTHGFQNPFLCASTTIKAARQQDAMDTPPDLAGQPSTSHQKPFTRLVNRFTPQPLIRKQAGLYMTDARCSECDRLVELGDVGYEDALCDNCVDAATERYWGPPHADHCTKDDSAPGGPHRDE